MATTWAPADPDAGQPVAPVGQGDSGTTWSAADPDKDAPSRLAQPWSSAPAPGSVSQAVGTGVIKGAPFGSDIAAAGVPLVKNYVGPVLQAIARPINRVLGVDQDALDKQWQTASAALPSSYSEAKERLKTADQQAAAAHPWVQGGAALATGAALLPTAGPMEAVSSRALPYLSSLGRFAPAAARTVGAGAVSGGYSGLYGAGEGDTLAERAKNAAIGTGLGIGFGSLGHAVVGEGLGALTQPRGAAIDAANRLGVPMPRYAVSNPAVQRVGELSKSVPVVGEWTRASTQHATDALNKTLDGMSGGVTPERAGTEASAALNDWIGPRSQDIINRRYTYASSQLDPTIRTPLNATNQLVSGMAAKAAQRGSTLSGRAIDEINNANTVPGGLTYDSIKDLRTTIGQLKGSWGNVNPDPIDAARITRLHGALSQDLDAAAARADRTGQGVAAHQTASRTYSAIQSGREDLTPLIGAQGDKPPEQVFAGLMRRASENPTSADVALLGQAKAAIQNSSTPQAWNTVEQGIINRLGRQPAAEPGAPSIFSPDLFLNHYSRMSDAAKKTVFSPQNKARLDDVATVAQKMKEAGFAKNTSGTSHMTGALGTMFGLYHAIPAIMAHPYVGVPAAAGIGMGARALSRPVTAQAPSAMDAYLASLARQVPIQAPSYLTGQQQQGGQ
jgi:hypothetical protein